MRVLEMYWSRALSLVCEVALTYRFKDLWGVPYTGFMLTSGLYILEYNLVVVLNNTHVSGSVSNFIISSVGRATL